MKITSPLLSFDGLNSPPLYFMLAGVRLGLRVVSGLWFSRVHRIATTSHWRLAEHTHCGHCVGRQSLFSADAWWVLGCTIGCLRVRLPLQIDQSSDTIEMFLLSTENEVYAWGNNAMGQCGQGHSQSPITRPRKVMGLEGATIHQISAGTSHSLAWTALPTDRWEHRVFFSLWFCCLEVPTMEPIAEL